MLNLFFLAVALFFVIKSADYAIKYASRLACVFNLPKYVVGFIIVAVISILPETFISINSALRGIPSFGLGTLFGTSVADLSIVFAIIIFASARGIRVSSKIIESNKWYPFFIALPILVGFDGHYSRTEGIFLIIAGLFFYYFTIKRNCQKISLPSNDHRNALKDTFFLVFSMIVLLLAAHFTVKYGVAFAESANLSPVFIGILIVGLGSALPELFFGVRAVRQGGNELALGDVLGTVISDATIAVGILALINPFYFSQKIIYITAALMVVASLLLFAFMRSGKILTKKEGALLFLFYLLFLATEYFINK